jgi:hypothetical protein
MALREKIVSGMLCHKLAVPVETRNKEVCGMDFVVEFTSTSRNSSNEITFAFAASSSAFLCALSTNPGGSACLYLQSAPFGHSQNQPNLRT